MFLSHLVTKCSLLDLFCDTLCNQSLLTITGGPLVEVCIFEYPLIVIVIIIIMITIFIILLLETYSNFVSITLATLC